MLISSQYYVGVVVQALRKKERQDETQLPPKLTVFWVSPPIELNANVLFAVF
jgi:ABC-type phosphate/phosphonate transport system substrate-binding protein